MDKSRRITQKGHNSRLTTPSLPSSPSSKKKKEKKNPCFFFLAYYRMSSANRCQINIAISRT